MSALDGNESDSRPIWQSLTFKLILFLSLALVPLGVIAVIQTERLRENLTQAETISLQLTIAELAQREREAVTRGIGVAEALGHSMRVLPSVGAACSAFFADFVRQSGGDFVFAGIVDLEGRVECSSSERTFNFGGSDSFAGLMENPTLSVDANTDAPLSGQSVVVITWPFHDELGALAGFISVSIPHARLKEHQQELANTGPFELFTVSSAGELLTSSLPYEEAQRALPPETVLQAIAAYEAEGASADGELVVAPIVDGELFAVGLWDRSIGDGGVVDVVTDFPALFPIAMWLSSLLLIYLAVERLVSGPVRRLTQRLRAFGRERRIESYGGARLPLEFRTIEDEFHDMSVQIIRDEAQILDMVHEKEVLLKEVHHRVKNNLQLIASIVHLQQRRADDQRTRATLEGIAHRVNSMATVHRALYSVETLSAVRADELLTRILSPLIDLATGAEGGKRISTRLELAPSALYPDQAMPLSLLAVELVTNALKYAGADAGAQPQILVRLVASDEGVLTLTVENTRQPGAQAESGADADEGGSLGSRLLRSFARQLEGELTVEETSDRYTASVSFAARAFEPEWQELDLAAAQ